MDSPPQSNTISRSSFIQIANSVRSSNQAEAIAGSLQQIDKPWDI